MRDLVLLHGFGFNSAIWAKLLPKLSADYTLHCIDLPGHGKAWETKMPATLEEAVELIAAETPSNAIYLGWSLGGLLATQLTLSYPEKVSGLMTVNSTPCFLEQPEWLGVSEVFLNKFHARIEKNVSQALHYLTLLGLSQRQLQRLYTQEILEILQTSPQPEKETLFNSLKILAVTDLRVKYKNIHCPFINFVSVEDPLTPINAEVKYEKLSSAGHFPMVTEVTQLANCIREIFSDG